MRYPVQHEKQISYFQAFMSCYFYMKITLLPHKSRAENSNAYYGNHGRHMLNYV